MGIVLSGLVLVLLFSAEASTPPQSEIPSLPAGLAIVDQRGNCGSGSCYLELIIDGPPRMSPQEVLRTLDRDGWDCRRNGLLDLRKLCVGGAVLIGDEVRMYVSLADAI
ncbi:hypothetical protein D1871_02785 [Nakamurella silvestris]|nr:hypothetical protein D1871_02785 [Nakamurella silvestris]